jgi:hypothetical protein
LYSRYIPDARQELCSGPGRQPGEIKFAPAAFFSKLDRGDVILLLIAALLITQGESDDALILALILLFSLL